MHTALILVLWQRVLSSVFKVNGMKEDVGRIKPYLDIIKFMHTFAQIPERSQ